MNNLKTAFAQRVQELSPESQLDVIEYVNALEVQLQAAKHELITAKAKAYEQCALEFVDVADEYLSW